MKPLLLLSTLFLALVITVLPHSALQEQSSNVVIDRIDKSESDSLIVQNSSSYFSGQSADSLGVRTYELYGAVYQNETKDSKTPSETKNPESLRIPSTSTVSGNWPIDTITDVVEVTSATGRIWMDRDLGAEYWDLYQWGRPADGHERSDSPTTTTLSNIDQPFHGSFILVPNHPADWRSPQNDDLWQGLFGRNNPCPIGFRLPTEDEWRAEMDSWSSRNAANSPLNLKMGAGRRLVNNGWLREVGSYGFYWSSTVSGSQARALAIDNTGFAFMGSYSRATGMSVRCIKD